MFNLSLEPVTKYNLCRFVDKSKDDCTSDKLRNQTLYFETPEERFELARFTENFKQVYRLARVRDPYFKDEAFFAKET